MSTEKADIFIQLAELTAAQENYEKSISHYESALALFSENAQENQPQLALTYEKIGEILSEIGQSNHALKKFAKSLELYNKLKNYEKMSIIFCLIGNLYNDCGQSFNAVKAYRDSIKYGILQEKSGFSETLYNMGTVFDSELVYPSSISLWKKALVMMRCKPGIDNSQTISADIEALEKELMLSRYENMDKLFSN